MTSLVSIPAIADDFTANFKGTDIQEFIDVVGRNLNKTIIVDPTVRGKIDVRSYESMNEEQYYKFFLNVLEVYGYAAIEMDDGILKIIKDKDAKTAAVPVVGDKENVAGDEVITRVVTVKNVSVRELSPILRQLNDNAGAGNVVHYEGSNTILLTGRASVVDRLTDIIHRVDQAGNKDVEVIALKNSSAAEMVRIAESLNKTNDKNTPELLQPKLVADERTNSILISGDPKVRQRMKTLINQLDVEMATKGNNRVIYLRYAKAEDLVEVLKGVSENLQAEKEAKDAGALGNSKVLITADPGTNALVLTAPRDIMKTLEDVISQLDIRRAQVLIEALIVEVSEGDGIDFGVQYADSGTGSLVQYGNANAKIGQVAVGLQEAESTPGTSTTVVSADGSQTTSSTPETKGDYTTLAAALSGVNGAALSVVSGDWTALISAVATNTNSNILSSPSIIVLDNSEASFIVGEEVPVVTGSTASSDNTNPFQTVDRKEVGIKLKVTPQINEGDSVQLKIEQEVSNVLGANGAVDVRFAKRQINTTAMIQDGQMIALGGLIDDRAQESESKVPLLGDIPVLGKLFSYTSTTKEKRNLMVFLKPTIIRDGVGVDNLSRRKYNYIRAEQLYRAQKGIKLLPNAEVPVMPKYGNDANHPAEIKAFFDQIEKAEQGTLQ
ncbi:MAG: type II secretion system secretin GspD [Vibrio sp.]